MVEKKYTKCFLVYHSLIALCFLLFGNYTVISASLIETINRIGPLNLPKTYRDITSLQNESEINQKDRDGRSPLVLAIKKLSSISVVNNMPSPLMSKILSALIKKSSINERDNKKLTPLCYAIAQIKTDYSNLETIKIIIETLLNNGANRILKPELTVFGINKDTIKESDTTFEEYLFFSIDNKQNRISFGLPIDFFCTMIGFVKIDENIDQKRRKEIEKLIEAIKSLLDVSFNVTVRDENNCLVLTWKDMHFDTKIIDLKRRIEKEKKKLIHQQCIKIENRLFEISGRDSIADLSKEDGNIDLILCAKKDLDMAQKINTVLKKYCKNADVLRIAFGSFTADDKTAKIQQLPDYFCDAANKNPTKNFVTILIDGYFLEPLKKNELPLGLKQRSWNANMQIDNDTSESFTIYKNGNITVLVFPYGISVTEDTRIGWGTMVFPEEDPFTVEFNNFFNNWNKLCDKDTAIIFADCSFPSEGKGSINNVHDLFYLVNPEKIKNEKNHIYAYNAINCILSDDKYYNEDIEAIKKMLLRITSSLESALRLLKAKLLYLAQTLTLKS